MARPTPQEIEEWEARMNEPEESDTDDFEVILFDENGNPVGTMPFKKAKAYFRKRGIDLDDEPTTANAPGGNASAAGGNAAPGGAAGGSQLPPNAPRTRATARYFGKPSNPTAVDPNNLPPGSQPI